MSGKCYMVLVEGKGEPRKVHFDIIEASQEAKRLAAVECPRKVILLEMLRCWKGEVAVKDHPLPERPVGF